MIPIDSWCNFSFSDFQYAFISILLEGITFLLGGSILSGLLEEFLPQSLITRILPKNPFVAVMISGFLGIIFPICECGIVPVVRRLLRKGLPISCGITYMLSAPIVNPVVILSTIVAFRGQEPWKMALMRLGLGLLVALVIGWICTCFSPNSIQRLGFLNLHEDDGHRKERGNWLDRLQNILNVISQDFLDVFFYFVIGAGVAALFSTMIKQEIIVPLASNPSIAIVSLMGLAAVLSVCSTTDAFIAATMTSFPMVAKLAFLVFGPMFDFKLLFLYSAAFSKRFIYSLVAGLITLIGLICWELNNLHFPWK